MKIGHWTVLREVRKGGRKYYECRCECGTVREIYYRSLLTGVSQSCGCKRKGIGMNDLTGQKLGKLTVIARDESRSGGVYWICECECGRRKSILGASLTMKKGPTRSCGCDQRKIVSQTGTKTIAENSKAQIEENMLFHTNFQVIGTKEPGKNNTSGHKGIWYDRSRDKWVAYIQVHGKRKFLGRFTDKVDAIAAREEAEGELFDPLLKAREGV